MNINSGYYNFSNSLFSMNNQSSSKPNNILGDYLSIKNGSYKKLLRAYYEKQEAEGNDTSSILGSDTSGILGNDTTTKAEYVTAKQDADSLMKAANKLLAKGNDSLFNKKETTVTDETTLEETTTLEYDMDSIKGALKNYIKAYNSVLDSASNTDNVNILRKATFMTGATTANSKLLDKIGISVSGDNKLSLDETKFKDADISDIKTLFQGNNSYVSKVYIKAFEISNQALAGANGNKLYGANGKINSGNMSGSYYNGFY